MRKIGGSSPWRATADRLSSGPTSHAHISASAPSAVSSASTGAAQAIPNAPKITPNVWTTPPLKLILSAGIESAMASVAKMLSPEIISSASSIAFG